MQKKKGTIAQLVEQRTENPCVPGSIPGGTTKIALRYISKRYFLTLTQTEVLLNNKSERIKNPLAFIILFL